MERFNFFMNSDCADIKYECEGVWVCLFSESYSADYISCTFANYNCFILFIKAGRIF